jgi:pimeloyl-ACP methyl ester carboxylesterase
MTVALTRHRRRTVRAMRLTAVVGALAVLVGLSASAAQAAADGIACKDVRVPVTVPGASNATIFGRYCPTLGSPTTVHLLVPASTMTSSYYDWSQDPVRYSYQLRAQAAGVPTFAIDRIGSGKSTRPASTNITLSAGAGTLHQVISALRAGKVGGRAFSRVVYVGNSLGSIYGWVEASKYQDVDAFVLTAMTHKVKPSFLPIVSATYYPAVQDPKFAGSGYDEGYLTTRPGERPTQFFYVPGADSAVIDRSEQLKDTVSSTEFGEAVGLISSPPADTAPSRAIKVPTLLVVGNHDQFFCDGPDGITCTAQNVLASEAPYYSSQARLSAIVAADSGHAVQLQKSAPTTANQILSWSAAALRR